MSARCALLTARVLRRWPLPRPDADADKEERGRVLVVGGTPETPGALVLAATGALRAGAGKVQIATGRSIAQAVALAVPEARVFALPETADGSIAAAAAATIAARAEAAQAVLVGPGMLGETEASRLLRDALPRAGAVPWVLDAMALACLVDEPPCLRPLDGRAVLTPHAGEMAHLLGMDKAAVAQDPLATARRAAQELGAVVALKGAETYVVAPDGTAYCYRGRNAGLATAGSGDTLAGIIAGLAARGAEPLQAAVWAVYLHGRAGDRLARRVGGLGFLARELLAEIPSLMAAVNSSA